MVIKKKIYFNLVDFTERKSPLSFNFDFEPFKLQIKLEANFEPNSKS